MIISRQKLTENQGILPNRANRIVFTYVNRKTAMNTYNANIAGHAAGPVPPGTAARVSAPVLPGKQVELFSGIRSSGQYCTPPDLIRTRSPVTTRTTICGRSLVIGMCP